VATPEPSATSPDEGSVRAGTAADLDAVVSIERASSTRPWPRGVFARELERRGSRLLLYYASGRPVAYVGFAIERDEASVLNLATHPDHRRRGYARELLERVIAATPSPAVKLLRLEVRRSNVAAIRLYRRLGFTVVGARPRYYAVDGEDALLMVRPSAGA
jgi:[ribosomal protein S18]-alanine N-acetyltransferase